MNVTVRLMSSMATARSAELTLPEDSPATVSQVLDGLVARYPEAAMWIYSAAGSLRGGVNVFVGRENVRDLHGLHTDVPPGVEVWIVTPESGG